MILKFTLIPHWRTKWLTYNAADWYVRMRKRYGTASDCLFLRYMDDVLILLKTKRQYQRAKKQVFEILRKLRLKVSPHKTWMGKLEKGFHYTALSSEVSRYSSLEWHVSEKVISHLESDERFASSELRPACSHEPEKRGKKISAVHPADIKRYLVRWASWWNRIVGKDRFYLIGRWIDYTAKAGGGFELISTSFLVQHNHSLLSCVRRSTVSFNPCTAETMSTVAAV